MKSLLSIFTLVCLLFVTVRAMAQDSSLEKFKSKEGRFTIAFPSQFTEKTKQGKHGMIYTVASMKGLQVFMAKYGKNETRLPRGKVPLFLEKTKELYVGDGKLVEEKDINIGYIKGKELKFITNKLDQKIYTYMRIFVRKKIWYTLMVYSNKEFTSQTEAISFFNSFRFI